MSAVIDLLVTSVELIFSWVYDRLAKRNPILALGLAALGLVVTLTVIVVFYRYFE